MYKYDDNMMPMNMITKQNKIAGKLLAWGRGKYQEREDGSVGYSFRDEDDFGIELNPQELAKLGVQGDDFEDCVAQIEDQLGAPINFRTSYGLFPNAGLTNPGLVVRSRINDSVICIYRPTSTEDDRYDAYFEWFYDEELGVGDLSMFLDLFDKATDQRTSNILQSPLVPSYQEAAELDLDLTRNEREQFLEKVWQYHHTPSRGYKYQLEKELKPVLKSLRESKQEKKEFLVKTPFKINYSRLDRADEVNKRLKKVNDRYPIIGTTNGKNFGVRYYSESELKKLISKGYDKLDKDGNWYPLYALKGDASFMKKYA